MIIRSNVASSCHSYICQEEPSKLAICMEIALAIYLLYVKERHCCSFLQYVESKAIPESIIFQAGCGICTDLPLKLHFARYVSAVGTI